MSIMELPEEFDPRLEAYKNPVAKTYSSGLGAKIQNSANGVSEGVTIQVSNVPKNMSEVELENLFSQCGNPKICKVRRTSHKLYMDVLVQYSKMSEVQSAIKRFNGQEPYNLKLSVVENKSQNRQELPVFNEPMAPATHDQIVRSTENFPAPNLPAFYDMYRALVTQPPTREFSLGRMFEQSISLSDNRRVHGGRVHWTRPKNTKKVRKTSDRDNDPITALRFVRSKKYQESGEEPMIPDKFSKRKCAVCGVLSNSCCNRCREVFYCCPGCQASHWADHKLVCGKTDGETAPERENGLATTKSENFERNVNNMSSRENSSREQWTVEKAKANEVSKLEEAKPLEVDSGSQSQSRLIAPLQACVISPPSSSASTTSLPYFKEGEIYEVIVLYNPYCSLDRTEFFVTKRDKKEDLVELQLDLNCEISDSSQQLENIEVNSKCAAKYDGEWYRAQVQKLDPLTVLCIDFGNEEICKPADLKELPPRFRKGLYTVRIRLPGPASKEQLKAMNSSRPFKLRVAKKEGKYWLADFANDEQSNSNPEVKDKREKKPSKDAGSITRQEPESRPEPNPDLSLLPNEEDSRLDSYKKITDVARENARQKITAYCETRRVLSHKLFTCMTCTIDLDSAQDFVKQINDLDLGSPADKTYRPQINEMVAVYLENIVRVWARGIVLSEINGSYNVALVDHGIVVVSSNLKKLPDAYKKIPLLSVKLSLESSPPIRVKAGEIFQITLLKNLADVDEWEIDVYLTSESPFHLGVGRLSSWKIEPDQVPELATQKLESGNTVIISSFHDINTIYVQPMTTQLRDLYECLSQEVAAECIKADYLDRDPFVGELVAAKWDQDGNHYRAQILGKAIDKGCYKVLFVDYGNVDNIHTSKMKSISNKLKSVPCCAIKVGLRSVEARTLTPAAYEYGIRIAENMDLLKIEFQVFDEVQLTKLSDNTDVNKNICELLEPSWMREQHTNTSLALQNYPMLQHLPEPNREDRFQIGRTERVLLSYVPKFEVIRNGRIQLTVCKASDKLSDCTKTLCKQMKDYIASQQKGEQANRYVPHKGELCVCLGKDDTPMRAECIKVLDGNLARLVYIDYGDQVDVSFNRIFKMTNDLMQLPAFATDCYADGIPANTTYEKISSVLSELDVCEAEIKSFDNERYTIHIPELIARLS